MVTVAGFFDREPEALRALVDTVIPADDQPGGWEGGVKQLLREHGGDFMSWAAEPLQIAATRADGRAHQAYGLSFAELDGSRRRELLAGLLREEEAAPGPFHSLVDVTLQGYYAGTSRPAGWEVAGFEPVPGDRAVEPPILAGIPGALVQSHYDAIVIGAGAGGGVVAAELASAGMRVLLVERGAPLRNSALRGNHLQGKRTGLYDVTSGPHAGNPRVLESGDGATRILDAEKNAIDYGLVAMTLGGGTRIWQGMAWRFWEQDFRMATEYGSPAGSTLADWPFDAGELTPFYDRVEWELGVSGDAASAVGRGTLRGRGYPMPPLPGGRSREAFSEAAARLGMTVSPIPFAINSEPRDGRAACIMCPQCVGHACPVDAKNGTHNTFIPRALATGNCDLLMSAQVVRVDAAAETARGVTLIVESSDGTQELAVRSDVVVVAAGAIETPRLLLASGLGNDWVGRNHHSHGIAVAVATEAPDLRPYSAGPGHTAASIDHVHSDPRAWGGGVLFDSGTPLPYDKAQAGRRLPGRAFGLAHKDWMRSSPNPVGVMSMVQEIPSSDSRVRLDPNVVDRHGVPAARLSGSSTAETRAAVDYMVDRSAEWLEEVGGRDIATFRGYIAPAGAEHSAGTVRLANSPSEGACDASGLLFGTRNVYIADASLHPTNGGFNPALTVMANAMRIAKFIIDNRR